MGSELYCPGCDHYLPVENFHKDGSRTRGFQTYCKSCHKRRAAEWWEKNGKASYQKQKAQQTAWRKNNPEKYAARQRRYHLRKKYAMTEADFQALVAKQSARCACCGDMAELVIDHDHAKGNVRELLCQQCNKMLGCANDSPERLMAGVKYLEKHNEPKD